MEDDPDGRLIIPISALQHYSYCPRQCALIHLDQTFDDNLLTVKGNIAHERVESGKASSSTGVRTERLLTLASERLGLSGKSDVVEFHTDGSVVPVEYKHGRRQQRVHDDMQLCAQALCLEEMLELSVPRGAIYHVSSRKRRQVEFTPELRQLVEQTIEDVRQVLSSNTLPIPVNDARCRNCSLIDTCQPAAVMETDWQGNWFMLFNTEELVR